MELKIGPVAHGGHCVARHEGRVVFVRHCLPGERVIAQVTSGTDTSKFLRADAVEIVQASEHRVEPPCRFSGPGGCGGCDWQHTSLGFSRDLKTQVVREQLQRLAGLDWAGEVEALPDAGGRWRTRVEFAVDGSGRAGLRAHRSHDVVPIDDCLISRAEVVNTGVLQQRWSEARGLDVVVPSVGEPVVIQLPERGPAPTITESVLGTEFAVSARGFWQVHPAAASTFVDHVMAELAPAAGERALDLYCGVGVFATFLADAVGAQGAVLGLEGDARAVEDSRAVTATRPQLRIERRAVDGDLGERIADFGDVDLVVLDPPRAGAGREVMQAVTAAQPRAIAYVACDPAALARDLSYAAQAGYRARSIRAFDAFPMTHHVECIAVLEPAVHEPSDAVES